MSGASTGRAAISSLRPRAAATGPAKKARPTRRAGSTVPAAAQPMFAIPLTAARASVMCRLNILFAAAALLAGCSSSDESSGSGTSDAAEADICSVDSGRCHSDSDCKSSSGTVCMAPGTIMYAPGSGPCPFDWRDSGCSSDADCQTSSGVGYCNQPPGLCPFPIPASCAEGCADDAGCGEGQFCGSDHRCRVGPCSETAPCEADHDCTSSGHCTRRSCPLGDECDGCCVNGACYGEAGRCEQRPL